MVREWGHHEPQQTGSDLFDVLVNDMMWSPMTLSVKPTSQ